ncbi:MAG TPA: protein phosphatase CheZ, partial [Steroidobacteraceae bacterium]|nr:protein phosphatase CheZ [Steroidobacteraceae bacterium]
EKSVYAELRRLTTHLHGALERFRLDSRLVDIAEREVPGARHRLDHVLKLTNGAAHRTMDLVEVSCPIAERISKSASELSGMWAQARQRDRDATLTDLRAMLERTEEFLSATRSDSDTLRTNLGQVLMAQDFQDLTGQIIRNVMSLVAELESTLGELVRLAGDTDPTRAAPLAQRGHGPAVPGLDNGAVVSEQKDVDSLLSGLGL